MHARTWMWMTVLALTSGGTTALAQEAEVGAPPPPEAHLPPAQAARVQSTAEDASAPREGRTYTVTGELTFISKTHRGFRMIPDTKKQTFGLAHGEKGDIEQQLPGLKVGDRVRVTYSLDDRCREQVRSVEKIETAKTDEAEPAP
jgi:hypothetical protein